MTLFIDHNYEINSEWHAQLSFKSLSSLTHDSQNKITSIWGLYIQRKMSFNSYFVKFVPSFHLTTSQWDFLFHFENFYLIDNIFFKIIDIYIKNDWYSIELWQKCGYVLVFTIVPANGLVYFRYQDICRQIDYQFQGHECMGVNALCPGDAIWWHRSGSTLVQVMSYCLTAPSHYLHHLSN